MNPDLAFEIVELALSLAKSQATGKGSTGCNRHGHSVKDYPGGGSGLSGVHRRSTGPIPDPGRRTDIRNTEL
jgi:hypothetical protein